MNGLTIMELESIKDWALRILVLFRKRTYLDIHYVYISFITIKVYLSISFFFLLEELDSFI